MTATPAQAPRGFWAAAQAEPDRVAVIDPAGREWTAGEIAADANRLVHALRARGLSEGDPLAMLLPNRAETFVLLMALFQAGWNFVPLNSNLTARRGRLHPGRRRRQGARGRRAVRRRGGRGGRGVWRATVRPHRGGWPDPGRLYPARRGVGGPACVVAGGPRGRPVHAVHVGHDGSPQGGRAGPALVRPRGVGPGLQRQPHPLRHSAGRGRRAPRDGADVPHGPAVLRLLLGALRAHGRPDGEVGRPGGAPTHSALPGHRRAHGAHAAAPSHAAAARRARALRRVVAAPGHPRRRTLPHGPQAAPVRMARSGDLRVLRSHRRRGHPRPSPRTGWPIPARSGGPGRAPT